MLSSRTHQLFGAVFSFSLLLTASAASAPAFAEPGKPVNVGASLNLLAGKSMDVSKPYGSHLQPILDRIKATPEQRVKIKEVVEGYRTRIQPLRDQYKQKQQEFLSSMTSGSAAETIMTRQVELSHLSSEITSRYTLMRLEIRRLLSPEQVLQFEGYAREHGWNRR